MRVCGISLAIVDYGSEARKGLCTDSAQCASISSYAEAQCSVAQEWWLGTQELRQLNATKQIQFWKLCSQSVQCSPTAGKLLDTNMHIGLSFCTNIYIYTHTRTIMCPAPKASLKVFM